MPTLSKLTLVHLGLIYTLIRVVSFLTWNHPVANGLVAGILIVYFGYTSIKHLPTAWAILVIECLLDGSGHFFTIAGLLLRTWFLGIFAVTWGWQKIRSKNFHLELPSSMLYSLIIFSCFLALAIIRGLYFGHHPTGVFQDAILFLFILILFPAIDLWAYTARLYPLIGKAFLYGSVVFSTITLFLYASSIGRLPDTYYHWFRNIASGKITDLGHYFFRIVLPEHLFIVPAICILATYLFSSQKNKKLWLLMECALLVLALNFSRIYFVALAAGFLILLFKQSFKRWFTVTMATTVSLVFLFSITNVIVSRGTSAGLELIGIRGAGITTPSSDVSGAIRLALLPDIFRTIHRHPWFGSGLSTEVTFVHPVTKELETRTQFDWGYLELVAELGILGTIAYITFLLTILYHVARLAYDKKTVAQDQRLLKGLLAGAVSLFIINITTPALFQGFGVLYFAFLAASIVNTTKQSKHQSEIIDGVSL